MLSAYHKKVKLKTRFFSNLKKADITCTDISSEKEIIQHIQNLQKQSAKATKEHNEQITKLDEIYQQFAIYTDANKPVSPLSTYGSSSEESSDSDSETNSSSSESDHELLENKKVTSIKVPDVDGSISAGRPTWAIYTLL